MSKIEKRIEYHSNGQKESEGAFKDGEADGLRTVWHANGKKLCEENHKDGQEDGLLI